jgi:hypothetical protein
MNKDAKNYLKIIVLIIVTLAILYVLHLAIGNVFKLESEHTDDVDDLTIIFETDYTMKTLTVVEIYPQDRKFYWPEIAIVNGSAELPYDVIEIGDVITNCEGYLILEYKNSGKILWEGDFR